jgi:hypothetical protein
MTQRQQEVERARQIRAFLEAESRRRREAAAAAKAAIRRIRAELRRAAAGGMGAEGGGPIDELTAMLAGSLQLEPVRARAVATVALAANNDDIAVKAVPEPVDDINALIGAMSGIQLRAPEHRNVSQGSQGGGRRRRKTHRKSRRHH